MGVVWVIFFVYCFGVNRFFCSSVFMDFVLVGWDLLFKDRMCEWYLVFLVKWRLGYRVKGLGVWFGKVVVDFDWE